MPESVPPELFAAWPALSRRPCFVATVNGKILWVNSALCQFLKYSSYELVNEAGGLNWFSDLGGTPAQLEADRHEAAACVAGEKSTYTLQRDYEPLHESPVMVTQTVFRYTGSNNETLLLVELSPSLARDADILRRYTAIEAMQVELLDNVRRINLYVRRLGAWFTIRRLIRTYRWSLNKYPTRTVFVTLLVVLCLLGYTEVSVAILEQYFGVHLTDASKGIKHVAGE